MGKISASDTVYTINYTLNKFHENVISINAKDGSSGGNTGISTITLNYNTIPSEINLTNPAANASGVSRSVTFKWIGGVEARQ